MAALTDRLDDWMNPIAVKELRQAVQSRLVASALVLFLSLQLLALGLHLLTRGLVESRDIMDFTAGRSVFLWSQGILLGTCMLLIPAYAGGRLTAERSDNNTDLMFLTSLSPLSIVWGKFFASMTLVLVIFSACAPFMVFTYLLRGIDVSSILIILGLDVLAVLWAVQLSLLLAAVPGPRGLKGFLLLGGFVFMAYLFAATITLSVFITTEGVRASGWDFWGPVLVATFAVLLSIAQMFLWTVALLSPPTSNRILPLRVFTLIAWGASFLACYFCARQVGIARILVVAINPMKLWMILAFVQLLLQFLISISERQEWGPRVTRTIPRSEFLRMPAFVMYSGAGGGVLFCILLAGLTFLGVWLLQDSHIMWEFLTDDPGFVETLVILALYAYAYGLTAVFLRSTLFRQHLKPNVTWVVAAVLLAVGCVLPYLIAYIGWYEYLRNNRLTGEVWWLLTNPVSSLFLRHMEGLAGQYSCMAYYFSAAWAGLITLVCVPWFLGQVFRFKPTDRPELVPHTEIRERFPQVARVGFGIQTEDGQ